MINSYDVSETDIRQSDVADSWESPSDNWLLDLPCPTFEMNSPGALLIAEAI